MKNIKKLTPFIFGIIVFFTTIFVGNDIAGPIRCKDGWHSLSIGRQGACSHHGGVDTGPRDFVLFLSFVFSIGSDIYIYSFLQEKNNKKNLTNKQVTKKENNFKANLFHKIKNNKIKKQHTHEPNKRILAITDKQIAEFKREVDLEIIKGYLKKQKSLGQPIKFYYYQDKSPRKIYNYWFDDTYIKAPSNKKSYSFRMDKIRKI
ncbi:MAG: hypothetical protein NTZ97_03830 [Candidatus Moranbacteria bacterium]|nr:hypothetical protein [Candidatus Moranbacteria bacterium]